MSNKILLISSFILGAALVVGAFLAFQGPRPSATTDNSSSAAPASSGPGPVVLVNNTPQANVPLKVGIVQPDWAPAQLPASIAAASDVRTINGMDRQAYAQALNDLAQGGDNVVLASGDQFTDLTIRAAAQLPLVRFVGVGQHFDSVKGRYDNLTQLSLPSDQIGYLAGALAAMISRSHTIGAVLGPASAGDVARMTDGFLAGAQSVDPTVNALIANDPQDVPQGYNDADWAEKAGGQLVDQGADVLFAAGGATADGGLRAARARGVVAIAGERDRTTQADLRDVLAASVIYSLDPTALTTIARTAQQGRLPSPTNADVQLVGLNQNRPQVTQAIKDKIDAIAKGLHDGSIQTGVP